MKTPWEILTDFLQDAGYTVVPPNHNDKIKSLTLVTTLGDGSQHSSFSTTVQSYYIYVNVPSGKYSTLENAVNDIIKLMKTVKTQFKFVTVFPSYEDTAINASVVQIVYKAYKKQ